MLPVEKIVDFTMFPFRNPIIYRFLWLVIFS